MRRLPWREFFSKPNRGKTKEKVLGFPWFYRPIRSFSKGYSDSKSNFFLSDPIPPSLESRLPIGLIWRLFKASMDSDFLQEITSFLRCRRG
jgi:hypothetical protein